MFVDPISTKYLLYQQLREVRKAVRRLRGFRIVSNRHRSWLGQRG